MSLIIDYTATQIDGTPNGKICEQKRSVQLTQFDRPW
jgi:hypothetical protein